MVKCPTCGMDVPANEYSGHWDSHQRERRGGKSTDTIKRGLERMDRWAVSRSFESMLKEGMEVLLDLGAYDPTRGSIYNSIAVAILSGYKDRWAEARSFIAKAIEDLR